MTTCPYRFEQGGTVIKWIGETLLGDPQPLVIGQIGFLEEESDGDVGDVEEVGRIDKVLIHSGREPIYWCALEIQAVYFSGDSMRREFEELRSHSGPTIPFPAGNRHPDFRSSGPKRLMPQLQIKVPTLRRWGKKMAVLVDRPFFNALGRMDTVKTVSNCDIAWFVVRYDETVKGAVLKPDFVRLTTLERAVEGLTGGNPVSLDEFESRIRTKLGRRAPGA